MYRQKYHHQSGSKEEPNSTDYKTKFYFEFVNKSKAKEFLLFL